MNRRHLTIALVVLGLAAGVVVGRERPSVEVAALEKRPVSAGADDGIDLSKLQRPEAALPQKDPFSGKTKEEPKAAPRAERPSIPPLPFQYFGKVTENGNTEVYVMRGAEVLAVAAGQQLGDYRVDQVGDSAISFTYLPLKTKQRLDLP